MFVGPCTFASVYAYARARAVNIQNYLFYCCVTDTVGFCSPIIAVANGKIVRSSTNVSVSARVDDLVTIECQNGYLISGKQSTTISCQDDFQWSVKPDCQSKFL